MNKEKEYNANHSYTEVYAWGCDTFGQLGISVQGIGKTYLTPRFCSFNIIIKEVSCGNEHTAVITSTLLNTINR